MTQEPDYRFSLANERTFLAWIRTSLALLAGGIGVVGVASHFSNSTGRHVLGFSLVALGGASTISAYVRWKSAERAMRAGLPLPAMPVIAALTIGIGIIALLALVLVVI